MRKGEKAGQKFLTAAIRKCSQGAFLLTAAHSTPSNTAGSITFCSVGHGLTHLRHYRKSQFSKHKPHIKKARHTKSRCIENGGYAFTGTTSTCTKISSRHIVLAHDSRTPYCSRMRSHVFLIADLLDPHRSPRCITQNVPLGRVSSAFSLVPPTPL